MTAFNLLLVEDNEKEIKTFQDTLERYRAERNREINVVITRNRDESLNQLNNSFDGAIVDIRLNRDDDAGNKVLDEILSKFRIPVVAYTANPANVSVDDSRYLKIFPRATVEYDVPLDFLFDMYDTGLTRIFGGRGYIETAMNRVFWKHVIPHLDAWKGYKSNGKETEKALLRFIINHIIDLVDEEAETYFPEETYISPTTSRILKTGSIVRKRNSDQFYVVLSPACDLVLHKGNPKTDRILVSFIEPIDNLATQLILKNSKHKILEDDSKEMKETKIKNHADELSKQKLGTFVTLSKNKYPYFHYLPQTKAFAGGIVNFRHLETFKLEEFGNIFEEPSVQISSAFTKDIVARFSVYYARQGQPDFDSETLTF